MISWKLLTMVEFMVIICRKTKQQQVLAGSSTGAPQWSSTNLRLSKTFGDGSGGSDGGCMKSPEQPPMTSEAFQAS